MRLRSRGQRPDADSDRSCRFSIVGSGTWRSACRFLVSILVTFGSLSGVMFGSLTSDAQAGGPPMPVISRGVPAYASANGGAAGQANDGDYSTEWRSTTAPTAANPQWLAYDLSGVPAARRGKVDYAWYNDATGDYYNADV